MKTPFSLVAAAIAAMVLLACSSGAPQEPESKTTQKLQDGDCSTALGDCYVGCQGHPPTPEVSCFTGCERTFRGCIGLPEIEQSAQ